MMAFTQEEEDRPQAGLCTRRGGGCFLVFATFKFFLGLFPGVTESKLRPERAEAIRA